MVLRKKQSVYNIQSAKDQEVEFYQDVTHFVRRFVDSAVISAMKIVTVMDHQSSLNRTKWLTYGNMNVRKGLRCVKEEMLRWNQLSALKNWMFSVKFISLNKEDTTEFYVYHVLWSIPTPAYPEPYVTVSVYFCIAASRMQPPHFPVDVTYVFEGHQFVHRLNIAFQPKWLYDILDMKTMLFKTFTF
ncbi:PREDICTED: A-kinase anchor protein 14-like [Trachymyrmex septentrionalis]|uniref:A-kinase anchor protein 14-like n=1 Tax=Trachymyrmex septentrionalis TaxID=34720 RepID=UPI00084F0229|nr:PREDICTED: A-kinase anchor protein 14-like [Trachymyrmex septentrionalis]